MPLWVKEEEVEKMTQGARVAVIAGGTSAEREVSLNTGRNVAEALRRLQYQVAVFDLDEALWPNLLAFDPAAVYIALHGVPGEDGSVQGMLDLLGFPYVGAGVLASSLAMAKPLAKKMVAGAGIRVLPDLVVAPHVCREDPRQAARHVAASFPLPLVVKPAEQGSAVGVTIVHRLEQLPDALLSASDFGKVMIEPYVAGKEITVAVLGEPAQALPVVEIVTDRPFYDYDAKYTPGGSRHLCPAPIDDAQTARLQRDAVLAHQVLGSRDFSRSDFRLPEDGSDPVFLEVNTLPGMTSTSLVPDAARVAGIEFDELIDRLIRLALQRRGTSGIFRKDGRVHPGPV